MKEEKATRQASILNITRYTDLPTYKIQLIDRNRPDLAIHDAPEIYINHDFVNEIQEKIIDTAERCNAGLDCSIDEFKEYGCMLFEQFKTPSMDNKSVFERLGDVSTPLIISVNNPNIFYELLFIENEFLCFKHITSRRLQSSSEPGLIPKQRRDLKCLLISNPTLDLLSTQIETKRLCESLERRNVECHHLTGIDANLLMLNKYLKDNEYDIIHYAGHIQLESSTKQYAFKLNENKLFWASNIKKILKGSPVVFLNGCWSAGVIKDQKDALENLTEVFLESGAQIVVGSLFKIPDIGARVFAEQFYENILNGEIVGEALRRARQYTIKNKKYGATWASFVMYGNPGYHFEFKNDEIEEKLNTINLSRNDFDNPTIRIIELALNYAQSSSILTTIHLFAAMIVENDSEIAKRFKLNEIPFEKFQKSIEQTFNFTQDDNDKNEIELDKIVLSNSVKTTFKVAQDTAVAKKTKILSVDLTDAFIKSGGGSTGKFFAKLGIIFCKNGEVIIKKPKTKKTDIHLHWPRPLPCQKLINNFNFHTDAFEILRCATEAAIVDNTNFVTTYPLFIGFLNSPHPSVYYALRQQGFSPTKLCKYFLKKNRDLQTTFWYKNTNESTVPSTNVLKIIDLANNIALEENRSVITDSDLLKAFIKSGGGGTGRKLHNLNIELGTIYCESFSLNGELVDTKFNKLCNQIFQQTVNYANNIKSKLITSLHLFYGMCLSFNNNNFIQLSEYNLTINELDNAIKNMVYAYDLPTKLIFELPCMSLGLKHTLIFATEVHRHEKTDRINERQLLQALLKPKESSIRFLLENLSINVDNLMNDYGL